MCPQAWLASPNGKTNDNQYFTVFCLNLFNDAGPGAINSRGATTAQLGVVEGCQIYVVGYALMAGSGLSR